MADHSEMDPEILGAAAVSCPLAGVKDGQIAGPGNRARDGILSAPTLAKHRIIAMPAPILQTTRLSLRPFVQADAPAVQRLAGDKRVSDPTVKIAHPYPDGAAEAWIANHESIYESGSAVIHAITLRESGELIGAISLVLITPQHQRAEIGYWIGTQFWSQNFCSEAAAAVIEFASATLGLTRITARCLARNPASARVLEKIGMTQEGRLPKHDLHRGAYEDLLLYGICLDDRISPQC
jgi:ribosomal-protein-alanine N-acetyltransferase